MAKISIIVGISIAIIVIIFAVIYTIFLDKKELEIIDNTQMQPTVNNTFTNSANLTQNDDNLTIEDFDGYLDTAGLPPIDMIIRTSGEHRLSNFFMWQCAYAEMFFCPKYLPDFTKKDLKKYLDDFRERDRRKGK